MNKAVEILPDTNRIWTAEDGPIKLAGGFVAKAKELSVNFGARIKIPEVVFQELVAQRRRALRARIRAIAEAAEAIKIMTSKALPSLDEESLLGEIEQTLKIEIHTHGYELIPTPFEELPWRDLVHDALNRIPPFEEAKEKGFRDALILQSAKHYIAHSKKGTDVYVVARDGPLKNALKANDIKAFETLDELTGHLLLLDEKLSIELATSIQVDAARVFLADNGREGFFYEHGVRQRILHDYEYKFTTYVPKEVGFSSLVGAGYRRVSDETVRHVATSFEAMAGKSVYRWNTKITLSVMFAPVNSSAVPLVRKECHFSVNWKATYKAGGFSDFELLGIASEDEKLFYDYAQYYGYSSPYVAGYGGSGIQNAALIAGTEGWSGLWEPSSLTPQSLVIDNLNQLLKIAPPGKG